MIYPLWKRLAVSILVIGSILLVYMFTNILTDYREAINVYSDLDRSVALVPISIIFYATGYPLLLAMPAFLVKDRTHFLVSMIGIGFITISSCFVFLILPTTTHRVAVEGSVLSTAYTWLHAIDGPNNCFPSMHVSLSCFIAWFLHQHRYCAYIPLIIAALVTVSTILTKQHAIIDIFGGLLVALATIVVVNTIERDSNAAE